MKQIKIIMEKNSGHLEDRVNSFLKKIADKNIINIQINSNDFWNNDDGGFCTRLRALILYEVEDE